MECHSLKKTEYFKNSGFCFETMHSQKIVHVTKEAMENMYGTPV
jgi:hypothetical protein